MQLSFNMRNKKTPIYLTKITSIITRLFTFTVTPCLKVRILVFFFNLFAARPDMGNIASFLNLALGYFAHITAIQAKVWLG